MKGKRIEICLLCLFLVMLNIWKLKSSNVDIYVTRGDKSELMFHYTSRLSDRANTETGSYGITIHPEIKYQEMDGFGAAMTGSTCYNLLKMDPNDRLKLLKKTFDPVKGYGYSFIRISIGCSDFSLDNYTYCDKPGIKNFRIHPLDKEYLFPILKEILSINPSVKILASPWTCPRWMKVKNLKEREPYNLWVGGQLNPDYYNDYALYFVKYIKAMTKAGFPIYAVTIQNEPLNRGNSASLYMTWQEQADFIKRFMGPDFERNGIGTKIIVYDHNYDYDRNKQENKDQLQYPLKIYADENVAKYVDGAAFHAYGGVYSELKTIHESRPDKNIYFTEMSIGLWGDGYKFGNDLLWSMENVCLGTINNYCKSVILWNFMLDDRHGPYRPGGCDDCLGAVDIDSRNYKTMTMNSHYYEIAHLSKVVHPGAYRLESRGDVGPKVYFTSFENSDGSYSVVLLNENVKDRQIEISLRNKYFVLNIPGESVISCIWKI